MAQELTSYDAVISDLEAKRDQLSSMIEVLKQMRGMGTAPLIGVVPSASMAIVGPDIQHDSFFGMTIPDASKKYLSIVKRTKPHPELCDALLEGGFKTSANNFREVVRSTLGRNSDFVKISGQWGLAEWYPNRTRKNRKAHSQIEIGQEPMEESDPLVEILPEENGKS